MKRNIIFIITFILFGITAYSQTAYVGPNGNDSSGDGSSNNPYKTIQKAIDTGSSEVLLLEGVYTTPEVITGSNVNIKPDTGANVVFNGTTTINNPGIVDAVWTQHNGNVYKTTLTEDIWQLFIDNTEMVMARWPNTTFTDDAIYNNDIWGHSVGSDTDGVVNDITNIGSIPYETKQLSDFSNNDIDGAIIIANFGSFKTRVRTVKSTGLDIANKKFEYDAIGSDYRTKHHFYFLERKLVFLDTANEWFYDKTTKTLYAWSTTGNGDDLESAVIRGKTQTFAYNLTNCNNVTIEGFNFFAATVTIQNGTGVQIKDNVFSFPNYSRRMLDDQISPYNTYPLVTNIDQNMSTGKIPSSSSSTNCVFSGNVFEYTDGEALLIAGSNHTVSNNYFHHIDWSCGQTQSIGLSVYCTGQDLTFDHNIMHTTGASATLNLGARAKVLYNDISNTGLAQSDGSIVQITKNVVEGTETAYNWLHDTEKYGFRFDAVAGDAGSAGKEGLAHHNVIWNIGKDGFGGIGMMIKGDKQEIYNNTVFNCDKADILILRETIDENTETNEDTYTINNAADVISDHRTQPVASQNDVPGFVTFNYSLYNDHTNNHTVTIDPLLTTSVAGIYDKNNVVANRANYNFIPSSSNLIDGGTIINTITTPIVTHPNVLQRNITENYQGTNPDIGAYESGNSHWIPGIDFTPTLYPWTWPGEAVPPETCMGLGLTQEGGGSTPALRWLLQNGCSTSGFDGTQWAMANSNDHTIDITSGTESGYLQLSFNVSHDGSANTRGLRQNTTVDTFNNDSNDILEITNNPNNDFSIVWIEHNWNKSNCSWSGNRRIDALIQYSGSDWNAVQNLTLTFNKGNLLESNVTLLKYCSQTININYTPLDHTASIKDLDVFKFKYAPNPIKNELRISANKQIDNLEFYNLLGQKVLRKTINTVNANINLSQLQKGIYIMKVKIGQHIGAYKIIKH